MANKVYLTRRETFAAAHRLFKPELTDEENFKMFGKCSNPNWHGHNYTLEVTVAGEINPDTGFIIDIKKLKEVDPAADGLAFAYPLWWGAPPAILQGWLQRVFTYGFAFEGVKGVPHGLLRQRAQILVTAGGPTASDPTVGLVESLQFCGMTVVRSLVNPGIGPGATPKTLETALKKAYEAGRAF